LGLALHTTIHVQKAMRKQHGDSGEWCSKILVCWCMMTIVTGWSRPTANTSKIVIEKNMFDLHCQNT
jgi:hypothetical protein